MVARVVNSCNVTERLCEAQVGLCEHHFGILDLLLPVLDNGIYLYSISLPLVVALTVAIQYVVPKNAFTHSTKVLDKSFLSTTNVEPNLTRNFYLMDSIRTIHSKCFTIRHCSSEIISLI